jgi:hypothetical protein
MQCMYVPLLKLSPFVWYVGGVGRGDSLTCLQKLCRSKDPLMQVGES